MSKDKKAEVISMPDLIKNPETNGKKTAKILVGQIDQKIQVKVTWIDKEIGLLQDRMAMLQEHRNFLWREVQNQFGLKVDPSVKYELQSDGQLVEIREVDG